MAKQTASRTNALSCRADGRAKSLLDSVPDHTAKAIELEDIEARVAALERAAEASKSTEER